ncbi:hypothetical protein F0562_004773 [Nyssa sinensis]|uniref:TF-B3 domain-containing protein n=1 Tax=Nyssa sinensis TaxID=561372 RepID=A0A5J5AIK8_9ASTE|nr:hypothetical protein F0562_004773 [Nyssa sinensis]
MEKTEAYAVVAGAGFSIGEGANFVTMQGDNAHETRDNESDRTELTRDLVAATSFGVQRKKRMTRQRRSSVNALPFPTLSSHVPRPSPPSPARVIDPGRLRFLFQKQLQNSDVGSLRRMILPKKAAESCLPVLETKEGIPIIMDDMDGLHVWSFKYRFWPNNNSRMYVLENTGEFVNTHGLQHGDYIMMYQDYQNQNYVIQARKASFSDEYTEYATNAVNDLFIRDFEVNRPSYFPMNFPQTDDTGTSFIYETTFSNDSPLDFLGGSMTNYSRVDPLESFGSIENLSVDDFY